jgi:hypothetical protein
MMTKPTNIKIYLVAAIVFGAAAVVNWWRAIEEGLRGRWLIPAVCFTVGAVIWVGVYAKARGR